MVQLGLIWDFEGHYYSLIYSHYKDYFASICSQALSKSQAKSLKPLFILFIHKVCLADIEFLYLILKITDYI